MPSPIGERLKLRLMHWSFLLARPMTLGVRAIVADADERVLLVRHGYVSGWHFPGGGVEPGETCVEAMARELKEEAMVAIDGPPLLHGLFLNTQSTRRDHVAVYLVRDFPGPGRTGARPGNRGSTLFPALGAAGWRNPRRPGRGSRRSSIRPPVRRSGEEAAEERTAAPTAAPMAGLSRVSRP